MNVYLRMCRPTPRLRLAFRQARIQAGRARGASQVSRGNAFLHATGAGARKRAQRAHETEIEDLSLPGMNIYILPVLLMYRVVVRCCPRQRGLRYPALVGVLCRSNLRDGRALQTAVLAFCSEGMGGMVRGIDGGPFRGDFAIKSR